MGFVQRPQHFLNNHALEPHFVNSPGISPEVASHSSDINKAKSQNRGQDSSARHTLTCASYELLGRMTQRAIQPTTVKHARRGAGRGTEQIRIAMTRALRCGMVSQEKLSLRG